MVNVAGLFALNRLTTNITGHFAFFADEMSRKNFGVAFHFLIYILAFFLGAFCSSTLVEFMYRRNTRNIYLLPVGIEMMILGAVALFPEQVMLQYSNQIASMLLFAMGMQNALVTWLSNSVVRTTHLTGLFTDLGIELSQLFFFKTAHQRQKLRRNIRLKLSIIVSFFLGGITGGGGYLFFKSGIFYLGVIILAGAMFYDFMKVPLARIQRRIRFRRGR